MNLREVEGKGEIPATGKTKGQAAIAAGGQEEQGEVVLQLPPSRTTVPLLDSLKGAAQLLLGTHFFSLHLHLWHVNQQC